MDNESGGIEKDVFVRQACNRDFSKLLIQQTRNAMATQIHETNECDEIRYGSC